MRIAPRCWFPKDHDGKFPVDRSRRELPRPRADLQPLSRQGRGWRGTPIGLLPSLGEEGIDTEGLGVTPEAIAKLLEVDVEGCKQQLPQMHEHHAEFGESRPSCTRCSRSWTSACTPTEPGDRTHSARRTPKRAQRLAPMTRSIVKLPADAGEDSEVYVNGVRQQPDIDFCLDRRELIFDRALRRDHVSGRRWLLGPWDMGTYRQDRHRRHPDTKRTAKCGSNTQRRSRLATSLRRELTMASGAKGASTIAREIWRAIISELGPAFDTARYPAVILRQTACSVQRSSSPMILLVGDGLPG